jgi:hypothetical protein
MAYVVDTNASIACPHGGTGTAVSTAVKIKLSGAPPILATDTVTIAGCAFNVSGAPSPCLQVQWLMPSVRLKISGTPVVLSSSTGLCVNPAGAPQGPATVSGFQTKVQAQ